MRALLRILLRTTSVLIWTAGSLASLPNLAAQKKIEPYQVRAETVNEARTSRAMEEARSEGPLALHAFLVAMPKGADLHVHLSGAVYAESWIRAAGEDGLCVDVKALSFKKPANSGKAGSGCGDGEIAVTELLEHTQKPSYQDLYDKLINIFSMRSYVSVDGWSGHDQFFATFDHFGGTSKTHVGEWIDEIVSRAAAQNEQYVELMETPPFSHAAGLANQVGWNANLAEFRQKLLDAGIDDEISAAKEHVETALALRKKIEHCDVVAGDSSAGTTGTAKSGCGVQVRFIYQILRGSPRQVVFAQTLLGFETIAKLPADFVGINFVQPEDGYTSMTDYTLQMHMIEYLHSVYPSVHISLHAGELAPGLVPPEGLRFHIRQAVEIGHAERIGHGVDVMYEDDPKALLKELADKHVMVEINLTSNDGILGIKAPNHPLPDYRRAGVPVALSTDDEGVSRIDLTHEYVTAAEEFGLTYTDLKQMARTGMEHTFLPGKSLWAEQDKFIFPATECRGELLGRDKPATACKAFLDANEKAAEQWEQERRLRAFEAKW